MAAAVQSTVEAFDPVTRSFRVLASTRAPVPGFEPCAPGEEPKPRLEALESWDLERFLANPVVLANHESDIGSIVGVASNVVETARGLEMTVSLVTTRANPNTDRIAELLAQGALRGVSVGFTYGERTDELRDGRLVAVFRGNELNEVSLVAVPADDKALVVDGRQATLDSADSPVQHFDRGGAFSSIERTQVGGIRVKARLTRTGVLKYVLPDGSVSRQLRLPDEVFDAESLATLTDAPVTDMDHHRGLMSADNFRDAALGHTRDARRAGKYVEATLVVNDAATAEAIERGELSDISCGYVCRHDHTPGVYDGEPYDLIHRDIRYNHVAVLAPGKGRAGRDVSIQLDAQSSDARDNHEGNIMKIEITEEELQAQRRILEQNERRWRMPLAKLVHKGASSKSAFAAFDAWDIGQLKERPNTSMVTPGGATARPSTPLHQRSFAELGVGVSKDGGGSSKRAQKLAGMRPLWEGGAGPREEQDEHGEKLDGKDEYAIELERERRHAANPPWQRPLMCSSDDGPEAA